MENFISKIFKPKSKKQVYNVDKSTKQKLKKPNKNMNKLSSTYFTNTLRKEFGIYKSKSEFSYTAYNVPCVVQRNPLEHVDVIPQTFHQDQNVDLVHCTKQNLKVSLSKGRRKSTDLHFDHENLSDMETESSSKEFAIDVNKRCPAYEGNAPVEKHTSENERESYNRSNETCSIEEHELEKNMTEHTMTSHDIALRGNKNLLKERYTDPCKQFSSYKCNDEFIFKSEAERKVDNSTLPIAGHEDGKINNESKPKGSQDKISFFSNEDSTKIDSFEESTSARSGNIEEIHDLNKFVITKKGRIKYRDGSKWNHNTENNKTTKEKDGISRHRNYHSMIIIGAGKKHSKILHSKNIKITDNKLLNAHKKMLSKESILENYTLPPDICGNNKGGSTVRTMYYQKSRKEKLSISSIPPSEHTLKWLDENFGPGSKNSTPFDSCENEDDFDNVKEEETKEISDDDENKTEKCENESKSSHILESEDSNILQTCNENETMKMKNGNEVKDVNISGMKYIKNHEDMDEDQPTEAVQGFGNNIHKNQECANNLPHATPEKEDEETKTYMITKIKQKEKNDSTQTDADLQGVKEVLEHSIKKEIMVDPQEIKISQFDNSDENISVKIESNTNHDNLTQEDSIFPSSTTKEIQEESSESISSIMSNKDSAKKAFGIDTSHSNSIQKNNENISALKLQDKKLIKILSEQEKKNSAKDLETISNSNTYSTQYNDIKLRQTENSHDSKYTTNDEKMVVLKLNGKVLNEHGDDMEQWKCEILTKANPRPYKIKNQIDIKKRQEEIEKDYIMTRLELALNTDLETKPEIAKHILENSQELIKDVMEKTNDNIQRKMSSCSKETTKHSSKSVIEEKNMTNNDIKIHQSSTNKTLKPVQNEIEDFLVAKTNTETKQGGSGAGSKDTEDNKNELKKLEKKNSRGGESKMMEETSRNDLNNISKIENVKIYRKEKNDLNEKINLNSIENIMKNKNLLLEEIRNLKLGKKF